MDNGSAPGEPEVASNDLSPATQTKAPSLWWNLGISSFWFSSTFKWFILLNGFLATKVDKIVPGGDANAVWGLVVFIGAAEAMIGPILFGYWSDRLASRWGRRRPFIAIGAAMTAVALWVLSGAQSIPMMIAGYLLLQLSDDIGTGPYSAIIPDMVPEEHRGRASGVMGFLSQLANLVGAVAGLALAGAPSLLFLVIAAVNIIGACIVLLVAREKPMNALDRPKGKLPSLESWLAPWRLKDFRWVWFTRFLNSVGFYAILVYLSFYLTDRVKVMSLFGLQLESAFRAQLALSLLISIVAAITALMAGKWADKIGRKKVILVSGYVMFAALVPFALIPNLNAIFILGIVFAAGYGAYLSADWALVADVLPNKEDYARDMGMWSMSIPLGQMAAGGFGIIINILNRASAGAGYIAVFLLAAFAFLGSTVLIRRVAGSS